MSAPEPPPAFAPAKVSVALCTYNGARHLSAQLQSILEQTQLPDELVICDDRSTDRSVEIAREYATKTPMSVRVFVNEVNLGSTRNFEQAIRLAAGDIILLCDQDDVWLPDKVKRFAEMFAANPAIDGFFSNAWVVSSEQEQGSVDLWSTLGVTGRSRRLATTNQMAELMVRANVVFGTVFGIRARARAKVLPIPSSLPGGHLHDGWIAMVLACQQSLQGFDEKLSLYRQHEHQQVGVEAKDRTLDWRSRLRTTSKRRRDILARQHASLEALQQLLRRHPSADSFDFEPWTAATAHLKMRLELPQSFLQRLRVVAGASLRGEYYRHSAAVGSPLRDLFF